MSRRVKSEVEKFQAALNELCAASQAFEAQLLSGDDGVARALVRLREAHRDFWCARAAFLDLVRQCDALDGLLEER